MLTVPVVRFVEFVILVEVIDLAENVPVVIKADVKLPVDGLYVNCLYIAFSLALTPLTFVEYCALAYPPTKVIY
jgi:hypothetical protein